MNWLNSLKQNIKVSAEALHRPSVCYMHGELLLQWRLHSGDGNKEG